MRTLLLATFAAGCGNDNPHPTDTAATDGTDFGAIPLDRMEAGVFGSRFAVATWPHD